MNTSEMSFVDVVYLHFKQLKLVECEITTKIWQNN